MCHCSTKPWFWGWNAVVFSFLTRRSLLILVITRSTNCATWCESSVSLLCTVLHEEFFEEDSCCSFGHAVGHCKGLRPLCQVVHGDQHLNVSWGGRWEWTEKFHSHSLKSPRTYAPIHLAQATSSESIPALTSFSGRSDPRGCRHASPKAPDPHLSQVLRLLVWCSVANQILVSTNSDTTGNSQSSSCFHVLWPCSRLEVVNDFSSQSQVLTWVRAKLLLSAQDKRKQRET